MGSPQAPTRALTLRQAWKLRPFSPWAGRDSRVYKGPECEKCLCSLPGRAQPRPLCRSGCVASADQTGRGELCSVTWLAVLLCHGQPRFFFQDKP